MECSAKSCIPSIYRKLINEAPVPLRPHQVDQTAEARLHRPPGPILQFQRSKSIPARSRKGIEHFYECYVRRYYERWFEFREQAATPEYVSKAEYILKHALHELIAREQKIFEVYAGVLLTSGLSPGRLSATLPSISEFTDFTS